MDVCIKMKGCDMIIDFAILFSVGLVVFTWYVLVSPDQLLHVSTVVCFAMILVLCSARALSLPTTLLLFCRAAQCAKLPMDERSTSAGKVEKAVKCSSADMHTGSFRMIDSFSLFSPFDTCMAIQNR